MDESTKRQREARQSVSGAYPNAGKMKDVSSSKKIDKKKIGRTDVDLVAQLLN